jgi:beta-1,4-mannosyltransferase
MRIACLPVAGKENPYQFLMMEGLRKGGFEVAHGNASKIFGIAKTAWSKPDYIHFDWETNYYLRRSLWMTLINVPLFILQVLFAKYIMRVRLVWTPHNVQPHDARYRGIHHICRRFFAAQVVWIRVFSESTIERMGQVLKVPASKFRVMPEGSYVGYYPNDVSKHAARERLGLDQTSMIFLYSGYIKPYKGIIEMMDAFKQEVEQGILLIVGKVMDQEYGNMIMQAQTERVMVRDHFIEDGELQYFMNAADVVVLPFKQIENSGSVILAMGFGKPVIAPAIGVVAERLHQQKELLYTNHISEAFHAWRLLSKHDVSQIGEKNLTALKRYEWIDFTKLFL